MPLLSLNLHNHEQDARANLGLDELYDLLVFNDNLIVEINSHTDNRGSDYYNRKLAQRRAKSCVNYLIEKGISKERLIAKGYGEDQPNYLKDEKKKPVLGENDEYSILEKNGLNNNGKNITGTYVKGRRAKGKVLVEEYQDDGSVLTSTRTVPRIIEIEPVVDGNTDKFNKFSGYWEGKFTESKYKKKQNTWRVECNCFQ